MNTVALIGRLGSDPQLRYTSNGKAVSNFSLAVTRPFNKDETDWFDVVAWGKTAELVANHLTKGRQVGVSGRLQQDRWEHEGQKRSKVVVVAENITFVGSKGDGGSSGGGHSDDYDDGFNPDDLPF